MPTIAQPVIALPVPDVPEAQAWYRDHLGFEIRWYHEGGRIGGVAHGEAAIFLRESKGKIQPNILWIFCADVDAVHADLTARGAPITGPVGDTPWDLREFTVTDPQGHELNFFHDI
ncbi:VOC family protein [Hasllibacter sp. MH4015]|uniref:VOC family protein n=1 Tax=Hasllibacter sp. MH4015 TaxID=2854029 RepID=UPI001CD742B4|nr:VOC family protein [Hasllibacter sp. MH4015]